MTNERVREATVDRVQEASWGGQKGGRMGGLGVHPWMAARPRQHWVFVGPPSPTTRPPRRRLVGWVRVVGLGVFSVQVLAGAGSQSLVMQAQAVMSWWIVEGRKLGWER
jgi:hypothetical protein